MFTRRPRRNRKSAAIRALVQETRLHPSDFVYPLFVLEGEKRQEAIGSMPGIYRWSLDLLVKEVERAAKLGIQAVAPFPMIANELRDATGSEALNPDGILQRTIVMLKKEFPQLCVITDVALDPFTSHGHDGLIDVDYEVKNDETVEVLAKIACLQAEAGSDMLAPSDMMDGRVGAIRAALDERGFSHVSIHSYTAKYTSAFYGPFREALDSAPKAGDKKGYQMNPSNRRAALIEALLDEREGADILMVKPALAYLDVISALREQTSLPISAYHVGGEYAMVKAAAQNGWIDGPRAMHESVLGIKRAGADMIFTYAAPELAALAVQDFE